ncbi:MAG: SPOR domain-containing protein, partial [Caulobacteraceae bacterium]
MTDPHRGSYGAEPPLAFEDRRGDRRETRRGGPAPVTLIVSLLLLAVAAGGVFYLYRGGVRGTDGAPEPVGAPLRDVRTPAPAQPAAADPAAGLSIYKADAGSSAAPPAFVAPPEEPADRQVATPAVAVNPAIR